MTSSEQNEHDQTPDAGQSEADDFEPTLRNVDRTVDFTQAGVGLPANLSDSHGEQVHEDTMQDASAESEDASGSLDASDQPRQLGRYLLQRVLGEGAFGVVYLGFD